jgi:hypothetical protein
VVLLLILKLYYETDQSILFPEIEKIIQSLQFETITGERKSILQPLVDFIQNKVYNQEDIRLNLIFIILEEVIYHKFQTAAAYYNIKMYLAILVVPKQLLYILWRTNIRAIWL